MKQSSFLVIGLNTLQVVFGIFLFISIMLCLEKVEPIVHPVVKDFVITRAYETNSNDIMIEGTLDKVRTCEYQSISVYVRDDDTASSIPLRYTFEMDGSVGNRAAIFQTWGPWTLHFEEDFKKAEVSIYVTHECHPMYNTTSLVKKFTLIKTDNGMEIDQ